MSSPRTVLEHEIYMHRIERKFDLSVRLRA